MKLNRKWILVMSLVLSVAMATSGTLAYLTDRESAANVLTLGNVDIKLDEDFDQGSTLIPGIDITKTPTIENVGKNDAWVWMTVAVPTQLANHIKINGTESGWSTGSDVTDTNMPGYTLKVLKYTDSLAVGATTSAAFKALALDTTIDIDPNGELYSVVNGTATKLNWNINTNSAPTVYVSAYAIQKDNFGSVEEGMSAYSSQWGTNGSEFAEPANTIDSAEDLLALSGREIDGNYILTADIDLNGANFMAMGVGAANSGAHSAVFDGNGFTISNINFVPANYNGMGTVGLFQVSSAAGTGTLEVNDLTVKNATMTAASSNDYSDAAVIVGYADKDSKITLNNVDVINATMSNSVGNAAMLVGYTVGTVDMTGCDVSGTVNGEREEKTGALVGTANGAECVINITNCVNATSANDIGRNIYGAAVNGSADKAVSVEDQTELDAALSGGATIITLNDGNYIIPDSAQGKTLTIIGTGDTEIDVQDDGSYEGCDYSLQGSTVTFENITITTDSTTYTGYARLNATYNNCTINGTYTLYGDSEFNGCTFNVSGDAYNIWTWGAPTATFNNCTFNSDGKALLLYGTENTNLTVNGCTFNDNGGLTDLKAAIEIGDDYGKSYTLTVNDTVVNGYEINDTGINTGTTLWANKNSMGTDKLNVVVDGVDIY